MEISGAGFRGMDGPLLRPSSRAVRRVNFAFEGGIIGDPEPLVKPPPVVLESVSLPVSGALPGCRRLGGRQSLALMPSPEAGGMRIGSGEPGSAGFFSQTGLVVG